MTNERVETLKEAFQELERATFWSCDACDDAPIDEYCSGYSEGCNTISRKRYWEIFKKLGLDVEKMKEEESTDPQNHPRI